MIKIEYPARKPSIKTENGKERILCAIRKTWMVLTPEEWVRQNILIYLLDVMNYPAALMAVEKQLTLGDVKKRFDIVLYKAEVPFILIECKEMNVPISAATLEQVLRYNINLRAAHFFITNGTDCYGFTNDSGKVIHLDRFPVF